MILLHGLESDTPLAVVYDILQKLGQQVMFIDQNRLAETEIDFTVGSSLEGWVKLGNQTVDLRLVTSAYLRPHDIRQLPNVERTGQGSPLWNHSLLLEDILFSWSEITQALVVNRPTSMGANNSKPYQSIKIRSAGFDIPDTLITTDPEAALEFWKMHSSIIYKSISGIRSIVSRFTQDHLERIENVKWCPTQFQEYIGGEEYRVHVVGKKIFGSQVFSKADDYRYAHQKGDSVEIKPVTLPKDIADRCVQMSETMGLLVSGIDLRRSDNGKWYCFEVNPSPAFTYFEQETGQPISEAIARLLIKGSNDHIDA